MTLVCRPNRTRNTGFSREMNELFSSFFDDAWSTIWPAAVSPEQAVNVWEEGETMFVEMEVPGVKSEDLEVTVLGGELTIQVRPHNEEKTEENTRYLRRERAHRSFSRTFQLPMDVDEDGVEASLEAGVLTIRLPKAASARPKKIAVSAG